MGWPGGAEGAAGAAGAEGGAGAAGAADAAGTANHDVVDVVVDVVVDDDDIGIGIDITPAVTRPTRLMTSTGLRMAAKVSPIEGARGRRARLGAVQVSPPLAARQLPVSWLPLAALCPARPTPFARAEERVVFQA